MVEMLHCCCAGGSSTALPYNAAERQPLECLAVGQDVAGT